jgi:ankyrin repeat protein
MKVLWALLGAFVFIDALVWASGADVARLKPRGPRLPPLYEAIAAGDQARVKALVNKGNAGQAVPPYGTPLAFAVYCWKPKLIPTLVEAGAPADDRSMATGRTPLARLLRNGEVESVRYLLAKGADPNAPCDVEGRRPLDYVRGEQAGQLRRALLDAGADATLELRRGKSVRYGEVSALLRAHGGRHGS